MAIQKITSGILADGAIVAADIANGSITTAKIADGNVTSAKIDTVANTKITGLVTASQIANVANTQVTGSIEATQVGTTVSQLFGMRNRIINGDMRIDQRNAGASITANDGTHAVDRFKFSMTQSSKGTGQQSTTAPTGFVNSLLFTSSSAYSVVASDQFAIVQNIEGLNVADLGWGTANAKTVTISFWVRSSLTGTFGGALQNSGANRSYPFTYTISAANTFEYKTITIAGDTSGTWLTTNGVGIRVFIGLGMGSTFSGTASAWAASNFQSATGATSVVGTNGATFYITGVQLEISTSATPFERRLFGNEFINCQRYFQKTNPDNISRGGGASGTVFTASSAQIHYSFPVIMRAAPTITRGGTSDTWYIAGIDGAATGSTASSNSSINHAWIETNNLNNGANGYHIIYNGQLSLSAEL